LLFFLFNIVDSDSIAQIPTHLPARVNYLIDFVLPYLFICFGLITLARFLNHGIFSTLAKLFFNSKNIESIIKEELRLTSGGSILLLVNYLVSFGACVFLLIYAENRVLYFSTIILSISVPVLLLIVQVLALWLMGVLTKEYKTTTRPIFESIVVSEFSGIILFLIALIWVLNEDYSVAFAYTFVVFISISFLIRIMKGVFSVLLKGVSWYYIILYFCTLEILPLLIAYNYIKGDIIH
jgi:hypothetical protein